MSEASPSTTETHPVDQVPRLARLDRTWVRARYEARFTAARMARDKRADVTCAVRTVPIEEAHRFGILDVDPDGRVTDFIEEAAAATSGS